MKVGNSTPEVGADSRIPQVEVDTHTSELAIRRSEPLEGASNRVQVAVPSTPLPQVAGRCIAALEVDRSTPV